MQSTIHFSYPKPKDNALASLSMLSSLLYTMAEHHVVKSDDDISHIFLLAQSLVASAQSALEGNQVKDCL